jgi:hypothetical protein
VENPTWVTTIIAMIINETKSSKLTIGAYVDVFVLLQNENVLYISKHHTMSFEIQRFKNNNILLIYDVKKFQWVKTHM